MPAIRLASADMPLSARLLHGVAYPVRGAALASCITLALCRYLTLLPSIFGTLVSIIIWAATWRYAIDCMIRTADGYADPPEVSLDDRVGSPRTILVLHVLVILLLVATAALARDAFWVTLALAAVLLPAIDMSLAFDGSIVVALNPATWARVFARFGAAYLIPVLANAVLALLVWAALEGASKLPLLFALPLYGFACTWLVLLDFHWMGLLVWHYRERFGMRPEAPELARKLGQGADDELVHECEALAKDDAEAAAIRLRDRIRERSAPAPVHALFRNLLHRLKRKDLLVQHGQTWIAQLCANGETRRALGIVQECREIDPAFVPDDPDSAAELARLASRIGMHGLAVHLAQRFIQRWPQHAAVPGISGLIADEPRSA
ncbi:MAG: hypothetical protein ACREPK_10050 [Rhodanobacteraceae bacterium]